MFDVNCHSSIRIDNIYIDPFCIEDGNNDAKYIFITHSHYDHYSKEDIDKIINNDTIVVCCKDVYDDFKNYYTNKVIVVKPNQEYECDDLSFKTFPSYNIDKKFHKKEYGWVGYIIEYNNTRYAIIGDSDLTSEAKKIKCDVLFVPIGGTYTMDAMEASELANIIRPKVVVPVHYNKIVGSKEDEKTFIDNLSNVEYKICL